MDPSLIAPLIVALVGGAGIGSILKTLLDHKRGTRKDTGEMAGDLIVKLEARIDKVEADLDRERRQSAEERLTCEAELRLLRHRVNNGASMIDALLVLADMPAGKAREHVARIREQWSEMRKISAIETATVLIGPLPDPRPLGG